MNSNEEKRPFYEPLIDFYRMNKLAINFVIIALALMAFLCWINKCWAEIISTIVSLPAFVLSFFVIKAVTISRGNLEAYHKRMTLAEKMNKQEQEKVKKEFEENLSKIKNTYSSTFKLYIRNVKNKTSIAPPVINKCKQSFNDLRDFYLQTYKYVYKQLHDTDGNLGSLVDYIDDGKVDILTKSDFDTMRDFFERIVPDENFIMVESVEGNAFNIPNFSQLDMVFGDDLDLFGKYLDSCMSIQHLLEGGLE